MIQRGERGRVSRGSEMGVGVGKTLEGGRLDRKKGRRSGDQGSERAS